MIKQIDSKTYSLEKICDSITCLISIIFCSLLWTTVILLSKYIDKNFIAYACLAIISMLDTFFVIVFIECTISTAKEKSHGFIDPNIPFIFYILGYLILNFLNIICFGILFCVWRSI